MMLNAGNKTLALLAALLITLAALSPAQAQDELSVLISRIAGTVEVNHTSETGGVWKSAKKGQRIEAGWQLRTAEDSKVQLVFPLDNVVILKDNTFLEIKSLDRGGGARLATDSEMIDGGSLLVDIQNALSPGSEFLLETPTALAVVRGTKYAAVGIDEYDITFHGFHGTVWIAKPDDLTSYVEMTAGTTVETVYGEAPAEPVESPLVAEELLLDFESTADFDAFELLMAPDTGELSAIDRRIDEHESMLADYSAEWRRYDRRGQSTHMIFLYLQARELEDEVDETSLQFLEFLGGFSEYSLTAEDMFDEFSSSEEPGETIREWSANRVRAADATDVRLIEIARRLQQLYMKLDDLFDDAQPLIIDNEDVYETLRGLIGGGKPSLWLRFKNIDTDNDGLSDVDEVALGLDPSVSNEGDGFIELISPDDGEEFEYPGDTEVRFEFEELESDVVERYSLVLETADGARQLVRQNADDSEEISLEQLVGESGIFADQLSSDGLLELRWRIDAQLDEEQLLSSGGPAVGPISSQTRSFTIQTPQQEDTVIIDLEAVGPTTITGAQRVTIRGSISEVNALGRWEIRVAYDPTVLDFDRGFRLGLFTGSTVFFGDDPGGIVTISGVVPRGSNGLSGEGDIFELNFLIIDEGETVVEVEGAELEDILGQEIESEPGDEVDLTIFFQTPSTFDPNGNPNGGRGKPGSVD